MLIENLVIAKYFIDFNSLEPTKLCFLQILCKICQNKKLKKKKIEKVKAINITINITEARKK